MKETILSGIRPTGKLHIGNYLGALKNFVALQDKYECYFFIADLHSLNEPFDQKETGWYSYGEPLSGSFLEISFWISWPRVWIRKNARFLSSRACPSTANWPLFFPT